MLEPNIHSTRKINFKEVVLDMNDMALFLIDNDDDTAKTKEMTVEYMY